MNTYFAYTRVSTRQQSTLGVSLDEQRDAIRKYADARGLTISLWFEETETAAKRGRKVFQGIVRRLTRGEARGLVIHKIDRSARNLRDWADIGDLIDMGIDVRFAHDDIRLDSRGGRLAADIQAVVAADYIRNLREEVRKGFMGRLKQGLYPLPAPMGYVNRGSKHAKMIDPRYGPIVREIFARYATGTTSMRELSEWLRYRGIISPRRRPITPVFLKRVLRNPFYAGTILIFKTGERYPGAHEPLVPREQFDLVQQILTRKRPGKKPRMRHCFKYQLFIRCICNRYYVGELHKGHVYYRCHRCKQAIREDRFEGLLRSLLPNPAPDKVCEAARLRFHELILRDDQSIEFPPAQSSNLQTV